MPTHFPRPDTPHRSAWTACLASVLALSGCAQGPDRSSFTDRALDLVGLQTRRPAIDPSVAEAMPTSARRVALRIHAGDRLNVDPAGRSLSLVAKVYALKDVDAFLAARYAAFAGSDPGSGAVELHEIVLTPGRRYEAVETVAEDVRYLGVVGLFRTPDERRWRFVFDVKTAAATGITVGAHGCGLSVAEGEPIRTSPESIRLAGVRCP